MLYRSVSGHMSLVPTDSGCVTLLIHTSGSHMWQLSQTKTCKLVIDGSGSMGSRQRRAIGSSFSTLPTSMGFAEKGVGGNGQVNSLDAPCSDVADGKCWF